MRKEGPRSEVAQWPSRRELASPGAAGEAGGKPKGA